MANIRNGNTFFIDTQASTDADCIFQKNMMVTHIIVTSTASNGRIVLSDTANGSAQDKLDLRVGTVGETRHFRFENSPISFPNGLKPRILSNAVVTVIIKNFGG